MTNLRSVFRADKLIFAFFGFLVAIMGNLLSDYLPQLGRPAVILFLFLLAMVGFVFLLFKARGQRLRVVINRFVTLRDPEERRREARRGLIVFVSLYNPSHTSKAKGLTAQEKQEAAKSLNYETLDLENSNLQPAIEAVFAHASRLEHCWLVSTTATGEGAGSSLAYASVLARYLTKVKGTQCQFYGTSDSRYAVSLDEDSAVTTKTRDLIRHIFDEAAGLGLGKKDLVADFTGCPKGMTLGLILACLSNARDIQFMGTHYNDLAQPVGGLYPVLFDFGVEASPD